MNKTYKKILSTSIFILLFTLYMYVAVSTGVTKIDEKTVPCYDNNDNEIIGVQCIQEAYTTQEFTPVIILLAMFSCIAFFLMVFTWMD
jgi:hypothetical protein